MKNTIILVNPLMINNKKISELSYDSNEINAPLFAEAETHKMRAGGSKGGNLAGAVEIDYNLHLYIGFAAVIAVNPDIDFDDLERIKGADLSTFMKVGRSFFIGSVDLQEETSEEQSEIIPEYSTPVSEI
jgi:hypothetical protein